jgi:restriction endonuclease BglII
LQLVEEGIDVSVRRPKLIPSGLYEFYEFHEWRNAIAVLRSAYPREWTNILEILADFRILRSDIGEVGEKGGGKSKVAIRMDRMFRAKKWQPQEFDTSIVVKTSESTHEIKSPTHEVDCFKAKVALELEWNNKTEFYDRDLNNFRLLFELRVADVGVIITRCDELQGIFDKMGKGSSYGSTTTVLSKLKRKLDGGAGGGCPVLAIGMKSTLYLDDITDPRVSSRFVRIERVTKKRKEG